MQEASSTVQHRDIVKDIEKVSSSPYWGDEALALKEYFLSLDMRTQDRISKLYNLLKWFDPLGAISVGEEITDEELNTMIRSNEMCKLARRDNPY